MKKLVFASVMALASISLVSAPTLRAQDSITIKDPAEYNAYQMANTQTDPKAKAAALESFLQAYPAERGQGDRSRHADGHLPGPGRRRQGARRRQPPASGGPQQHEGHLLSVVIKKSQCQGRDPRRILLTRRPATMPQRWPRRGLRLPSRPASPTTTGRS